MVDDNRERIGRLLLANNMDWRCLEEDDIRFLMQNARMTESTRCRMRDYLNPQCWKLSTDPKQNPLPPGVEMAHGRLRATSAEGRAYLQAQSRGENPGPRRKANPMESESWTDATEKWTHDLNQSFFYDDKFPARKSVTAAEVRKAAKRRWRSIGNWPPSEYVKTFIKPAKGKFAYHLDTVDREKMAQTIAVSRGHGAFPMGMDYDAGKVDRKVWGPGRVSYPYNLTNPGPHPKSGPCCQCSRKVNPVYSGKSIQEIKKGGMWTPLGIICKKCAKGRLEDGHCPYCNVGLGATMSGNLAMCDGCGRGFRDGYSGVRVNPVNPSGVSSASAEKAMDRYRDFNMQEPKIGWEQMEFSLPGPDNPLIWLGPMREVVYISDKEGEVDNVLGRDGEVIGGQEYVHTLKKPYPMMFLTADGKTLIVPLKWKQKGKTKSSSLRIKDGWMRESDE